jgi:hypothetical protein
VEVVALQRDNLPPPGPGPRRGDDQDGGGGSGVGESSGVRRSSS